MLDAIIQQARASLPPLPQFEQLATEDNLRNASEKAKSEDQSQAHD